MYPIARRLAVNSKHLEGRLDSDVHQLLRCFEHRVFLLTAFDVLLRCVFGRKNVNQSFAPQVSHDEGVANNFYAVSVAHGRCSNATIRRVLTEEVAFHSLSTTVFGDSTTGIALGCYTGTLSGLSPIFKNQAGVAAVTGLQNSLSGIDFSAPIPFGLVIGAMFGTGDPTNTAGLYQFSVSVN